MAGGWCKLWTFKVAVTKVKQGAAVLGETPRHK